MSIKYEQVAVLLNELELGLKAAELWSQVSPHPDKLKSTQPFARDTLDFEQWLQFIFIPQFQLIIKQQKPLPESMAILPMAQMRLPGEMPIHLILQQLDEVVSGK